MSTLPSTITLTGRPGLRPKGQAPPKRCDSAGHIGFYVRHLIAWAIVVAVAPLPPTAAAPPPPRDVERQSDTPVDAGGKPKPAGSIDAAITTEDAIRRAIELLDTLDELEDETATSERLDQVREFLSFIRERNPSEPWISYLAARVNAATGRNGDAVEQLRDFVETPEGRNEWTAYRLLGDLFVGDYPSLARTNYEKALALHPNEPSVLFGLSVCHRKRGAVTEALKLARNAVSADGRRSPRYLAHLATLLASTGAWDEARREAEVAVSVAKDRAEARRGQRSALVMIDAQYQVLRSVLQGRIREADGAAPADYLRLSEVLMEQAALHERLIRLDALRVIDAGLEARDVAGANAPAELVERRAVLLAEIGRIGEAIAAFEKLQSIDADNAAAAEWLPRLRAGETKERITSEREGEPHDESETKSTDEDGG